MSISRQSNKAMGAVRRSNYVFEYRITVLGASSVGKTSLIQRFMRDTFEDTYNPTALDHLQHIVDYKGNMCVCLLADTSGSMDFPAMRRLSISKGNGFIVAYSVTDRSSFETARQVIADIKEIKNGEDEIKVMLVANKSDLEKRRVVTRQEGLQLAESVSYQCKLTCDFVEASAKDDNQVIAVFHGMLNMFLPEAAAAEVPERRSSLSRTLSLRRSRRSKQQKLMQQNSREDLIRKSSDDLQTNERLHKSSDDIPKHGRKCSNDYDDQSCQRDRAMSLGSAGISDEKLCEFRANYARDIASAESSPVPARKTYVRQNSAKDILRRTSSVCKGKFIAAKRKLQGVKPQRQQSVLVK